MDSISAATGAPGLAQVYMLRKTMDLAQSQMASMLAVLPPTAPFAPTAPVAAPGRLDTYA
jgi:hypothetical protein